VPPQLYRCGHCEAMFEDLTSLEAHIDACAGNQEQAGAQEGYQCSLCWENGEVLIVTTVEAFNAHTAEVHGDESVVEVAEGEVQLEESGGGLDNAMGQVEEMAEPPLDSKYLMEKVVGDETGMMVLNLNDEENPDIGTTEVFVNAASPHHDGNHNSIDEGESGHICSICQNGFANEILLEEHKREHPTCPICFSKLLSRAHYKDHIEEHPNCSHCGVKVAGNIELENHLLFEHVISNNQQTAEKSPEEKLEEGSHDKLTTNQSLQEGNVAPTRQTCTGGGVEARRIHSVLSLANPELEVEIVTQAPVLPEEQVAYVCPAFDDSLKVPIDKGKAYPLSVGGSEGIFELSVKCQFCRETFPSMEELADHVAQKHSEVEEDSGKSAVDPGNRVKVGAGLEQKMIRPRIQEMSANPPFFCDACPDKREFQKVLHLKRHVDKEHPVEIQGGVQFQCQLCKHLPFLQLDTLQRHMGVEHGHVEKHTYACPLCENSYEGLGRGKGKRVGEGALKLRDHMRRHDAVHPRIFGCSICKGSFSVNAVLFTHTKKCDGTPPEDSTLKVPKPAVSITLNPQSECLTFRCVKCVTTFSSHELFACHPCNLETEGINKYHCAQCGDTFEAKTDFKKHMAVCERNMKKGEGKRRRGVRKPRKRKAKVELQELQLQVEDGVQLFADYNLNNFVGHRSEVSSGGVDMEAGEGLQVVESCSQALVAATWDCRACHIQYSDQVELAHHYQESGKCRETLAGVSQMEQAPALLEPAQSLGGEFHCLPCNYSSEVSHHYQRHLKSQKHQRMVAESRAMLSEEAAVMQCAKQTVKVELEEEPSSSGFYQCLQCEYSGKDHTNYLRHLKTQKHKKSMMEERAQSEEENSRTTAKKRTSASAATVVTSSGRKVIPKRFIGDYEEPDVRQSRSGKRRKIESGNSPDFAISRGKVKKKEDPLKDDHEVGAPLKQWSCGFCPILSSSPKELFTHMVTHVPPEVLDSAGVQPDQGWCPFCPGPVGLARAKNHMSVVHPHA